MKKTLRRGPLIGAICIILILIIITINLHNDKQKLANTITQLNITIEKQSVDIDNLTKENEKLQSQIEKLTTENKRLTEASKKSAPKVVNSKTATNSNTNANYSASQFKKLGVIRWGGYKWTWYSQKVLPGGGLKIPGRHVDENGYVCDENNYICLASSTLAKGTVISTPFGKQGKIYDAGCAAGVIDVYVNF